MFLLDKMVYSTNRPKGSKKNYNIIKNMSMKTFISKYNLKLKDNKVEIINLNSNNNGIIYINK